MKTKLTFTRINIVFLILAVLWMGIIFYFSNRTADESNNTSDAVETAIGKVTVDDFEQKSEEEVVSFLERYRVLIRKTAHILEFTLLCMLAFMALPFGIPVRYRLFAAGAWTLLYAISDEIHQAFIPGRTGLVSDVLIDTVGMLIGIAGILFLRWLIGIIKKSEKAS